MGPSHGCGWSRKEILLGLQNRFEFDVGERSHCLCANKSEGREPGEKMENAFLPIGLENEDSVVAPDRPVLTFDGDSRFGGEFVEVVGA